MYSYLKIQGKKMYTSHSITSLKYRIKIIGTKINRIYTNLEIHITYIY